MTINARLRKLGKDELTKHQCEIIETLLARTESSVDSGSNCTATLSGAAGTGKTTTMVGLVAAATVSGYNVAVAAPTHKAANVLTEKLEEWEVLGYTLPKATTIHSLLRLKPKKTKENVAEAFDQTGRPPVSMYDIIIVDECSMVGVELYNYIIKAQELFNGLLLFTGDPNQLPPVNETKQSKAFSSPECFELTEVLRHDGAILNVATKVRNSRFLPQIVAAEGGGTEVETYLTQEGLIERWLERLRSTKSFNNDIILLCWVNKNRRKFNRMAREALYGVDAPEFMVRDNLVAIKPIMKGDEIIYGNNADIEVTSAEHLGEYSPPGLLYSYKAWKLGTANGHTIFVVDDADHARWLKDINKLGREISKQIEQAKAALDQAMRVKNASPTPANQARYREARVAEANARSRWVTEYFPLKGAFADVDFGYALTIHKSQGSTYREVFVYDDYTQSRNERLALLYVAVTRASHTLHHLHTGLKLKA